MLLLCSVNTFFRAGKEFPHTAVEAPKVRAIWNAVRTLGIASSTLCKSTKQCSQCPCTGDIELAINRHSLSRGFIFSGMTNAMDSMNAVFFCPKRHSIIPECIITVVYPGPVIFWLSCVPNICSMTDFKVSVNCAVSLAPAAVRSLHLLSAVTP